MQPSNKGAKQSAGQVLDEVMREVICPNHCRVDSVDRNITLLARMLPLLSAKRIVAIDRALMHAENDAQPHNIIIIY